MNAGIEAHLNDVSMQVVKHRRDDLRKIIIVPLKEECVHYCEAQHKIILEKYSAEEGVAKSIIESWGSSNQQKNVLIRGSMGDKNFNIFEINGLCIST